MSKTLQELGLAHVCEDSRTGLLLDLYLPQLRDPGGAGRSVAIEVEGPGHFLRCAGGALTFDGFTQSKEGLLGAMGVLLVQIPYYEWDLLLDAKEKQEYVSTRLRQAQQRGVC